VALLRPYCRDILVVSSRLPSAADDGSREHGASGGVYDLSGIRIVRDVEKGKGPLMGLYSGLSESKTDHNFITACDMPFFEPELFLYMRRFNGEYDAVVPRMNSYIEPLFAFFNRRCLDSILSVLERGQRRIRSFLDLIRVRYVEEIELRRFDPELISFYNINTLEDLQAARVRVAKHSE
jgi:molybdopterin-guanine dinucleotide biosynthesis protein A